MAADELVALYDPDDDTGVVTGCARRDEVRARNLPHAATAVLVRNGRGQVYLHRRTDTKDVYPGLYDVWAGGCVGRRRGPATTPPAASWPRSWASPACSSSRCSAPGTATTSPTTSRSATRRSGTARSCTSPRRSPRAAGWTGTSCCAGSRTPDWPFVPDGRAGMAHYLGPRSA